MKDFFISYNKADEGWAEWIAWQLEEESYTTVVQAWDFVPGSNFVLEMQKAAAETERTIAVLSPDYLASGMTQPEWAARFVEDSTGDERKLVPVRVRECELKGLLKPIVYVDLVGMDQDAAKQALIAAVRPGRAKPEAAPGFPPDAQRSVAERPRFPGALPPVWNVPHQRNPNFTGRKSLLSSLHESLASGHAAAVTQAIAGLGGVGKTQLALEYAYRYVSEYDVVWWVRSEEAAALGADYAALAGALDLPEKDATDQRVVVEAVRQWLERSTGWILVFDNAREASQLSDYLPRGGAGHVLITSRNPAWRSVAAPLSVQMFERDESIEFLLRRSGEANEAAAGALAEALGDLPLALAQAAAYMEQTGRPIGGYLVLYRQRRQELLKRGGPPTDYPDTVATTWDIAFQELEAASPAGADLLRLAAYLAPDDIPLGLLAEGGPSLPEPLAAAVGDPLALDTAMAAMRRYSLAEVQGDALSVHRLVQAAVRDRLADGDKKGWAASAVSLVNAAFPYEENDPATWTASARLLPHALASARHAELGAAAEATGRLLNQAGSYMETRAEFDSAKGLYERALAVGEQTYGTNHPNVAALINNIGFVLSRQGDLEGAKDHFERALAIDEKTYGPDHPEVAISVNNLGNILRYLGDLEGARKYLEWALVIDEKTYGSDHPTVATHVSSLGFVLRDLGDLNGAMDHFVQALAICEKSYGPDHSAVAVHLDNMGLALQGLGDLVGAREHHQRALAIDEKTYGPDHPDVARDVNNLGVVLRASGDPQGARVQYQRALRILQEFLGDDHPNAVLVRNNMRSLDAS